MAHATRIAQADIAGVTASADLSATAKLHTAVVIASTGLTATTVGANAFASGIQVNSPESGQAIDIMMYGVIDAQVDGNAAAIAPGDPLESNASGQLVKSTVTKHKILAWSMGVSVAAGDVIPVLWVPSIANV